MQKVFSETYYGGEEQEKPDISDESDMDENFAEEKELEDEEDATRGEESAEPKPSTSAKGDGKRKRRTKVSEAVRQAKPVFDPGEKTSQNNKKTAENSFIQSPVSCYWLVRLIDWLIG